MIPENYSFGQFVCEMDAVSQLAYDHAEEKGFHQGADVGTTTRIALCHSELSEMLESVRSGNMPSEKIHNYTQAEEEAADVVIRLMDMCRFNNWKLGGAIAAKMRYNQTRSHMHGGKKF